MKNVPTNLNDSKSKVDKLDTDKLVPVPVGLSKINHVVKIIVLKKMCIMGILKVKYLILPS